MCRTEKRERRREAKAETAAQLETSIETELLQRLKAGTYGDIYNIPHAQYEKVLTEQVRLCSRNPTARHLELHFPVKCFTAICTKFSA